MDKSLVNNSIFNVLKTFSSIVFPVVTFAYASRVLGDAGIGQVSFTKSVISLFTMLAMLGMNYYGTREAAKLRDDRERFSRFAQEMLLINGCTTLLAYAMLFAAVQAIPKLRGYEALLAVNSVAILLQGMGMEWLYQAMEEYRYIALRSVLFQIISLAALFLFVRDAGDVLPYAAIQLTAASGSYILNFINARKFIRFKRFDHYEIKKHIKPLLWLFAMVVSIELYTVLDSTMLGFLQTDASVGRYSAAVRVNKMVNSLITAAGSVLVPRLSYYIHRSESEKIRSLVVRSYNYVFMLSVPAAVGLFMLSDHIIRIFCGIGFATAGVTMRILTPIVIVIPMSGAANLQIFVPMNRENLVLRSTLVGAAVNFTLNMILIPRFAENGAAVATVVAETAVTAVCMKNIGKYYSLKSIFQVYYQYVTAAVPIIPINVLVQHLPVGPVLQTCLAVTASVFSYFAVLLLFKNPYCIDALELLWSRIRHDHQGRDENGRRA